MMRLFSRLLLAPLWFFVYPLFYIMERAMEPDDERHILELWPPFTASVRVEKER